MKTATCDVAHPKWRICKHVIKSGSRNKKNFLDTRWKQNIKNFLLHNDSQQGMFNNFAGILSKKLRKVMRATRIVL